MIKKNPKADLRSYHTLFVQLGIICSLLFIIAASNLEIKSKVSDGPTGPIIFKPDTLTQLPPIIPPKKPAPHKPSVFTIVPDHELIEPDSIIFGDLELDGHIPLPPIDPKVSEDEIINFASIMPQLKGGLPTLYKEIRYPEVARRTGIEGRVQVQFVVNKEGKVENPEILRGIGGGCDEEVLRVIKLMSFSPGIQNGQFVNVRMAQSVNFKLQN